MKAKRGGRESTNGMGRKVKRAVLAYSGGLDTSIIVPWLKEHYGCEVVCYCSDVGQGAELDGLEARARKSGASDVRVEDLRLPFVRDFCFPALRAGAIYEGSYLLGARWRARSRPAPTRSRTAAPARATTRCASSWPTWRSRRSSR
jgi:argininosuccinate synthase